MYKVFQYLIFLSSLSLINNSMLIEMVHITRRQKTHNSAVTESLVVV